MKITYNVTYFATLASSVSLVHVRWGDFFQIVVFSDNNEKGTGKLKGLLILRFKEN